MPNGKPGDHPMTDWKAHGRHPFPPEIEKLLAAAEQIDPRWQSKLPQAQGAAWEQRYWDWYRGVNIEEGLDALRALLKKLERGNQG